MTSLRAWMCGALAFAVPLAGTAPRAEGLIGGQPLQNNQEYRCNGERVVVRCRDTSDDAECQVGLPDRPLSNGRMVQSVGRRSEVIRMLQACEAPQSRPSAGGAPTAAVGKPPPPLGNRVLAWRNLSATSDSGLWVAPSTVKRTGASAEGWLVTLYPQPRDTTGGRWKGVSIVQYLWRVDCARNVVAILGSAHLSAAGAVVGVEGPGASGPVTQGSRIADVANAMCGRPPSSMGKEDDVYSSTDLLQLYRMYLDAARQQAGGSPTPPAGPPAATPPPAGAPARRPAAASQFSGPAICAAIRRAGSLAGEGFRSVDLGPGTALTDEINIHRTSLQIPGAHCGIRQMRGQPNSFSCNWPNGDAAERQFAELSQTLKTCVAGDYVFHPAKGDIDPYATVRAGGVEYQAALDYDFVSLQVQPLKTAAATPVAPPRPGRPFP